VTVEFWSRCLAQTRAGASLCSRSLPLQCRAEAARASRKLLDQPFGVLAALLEQPGSVVTRYVRRFRPRSKQGHQPHQRGPQGHGVCSTLCRNSSETRVSIHRVHRSFSHPGTSHVVRSSIPPPDRGVLRATFCAITRWIPARLRGCRRPRQKVSVGARPVPPRRNQCGIPKMHASRSGPRTGGKSGSSRAESLRPSTLPEDERRLFATSESLQEVARGTPMMKSSSPLMRLARFTVSPDQVARPRQ
jgi:hypothetical protein